VRASELFNLPAHFPFQDFFKKNDYPWDWVAQISQALESFNFKEASKREDISHELTVEGNVFIHPNVKLPPYGYIKGPVYIGAHTELRPGVLIRGNVIVGEKCVLGNACEFKNCLLMDSVQVPHFNYIGDSILGTGAHFGAGAITANLRLDHQPVSIKLGKEKISTKYKKLGALVGELAEIGCNAVLQPGTILAPKSAVGPCLPFGGYLDEGKSVFMPRGQER